MLLAAWICLWHASVILRSTLFHSTAFHAFCRPERVETEGIRLNVCPFACRFGNPGLFAVLCSHYRPGERAGLGFTPVCRRRGGGPPSTITHTVLAAVPLLVMVGAFYCLLVPLPAVFQRAERLFMGPPTTETAPRDEGMPKPEAIGPAPAETSLPSPDPAAATGSASEPDVPSLPPSLRPDRSTPPTALPPPPLGMIPQERHVAAVSASPRSVLPQPLPAGLLATLAQAKWSGDYSTALAAAKSYSKSAPDHVAGMVLLARAALECHETVLAETTAQRILRLEPKTAEAWAILGRLHAAQGDATQAEQEYRQALALDPRCELAATGLAHLPAGAPRKN